MTNNMQQAQWMQTLVSKYSAGVAHGFILHFNTSDYVVGSMHLRDALARLLAEREIVVFYNASEGLTFAQPSMKERFTQLLGLDAQFENDALAALNMSQGKQDVQLPSDPSAVLPLLEKLLKMGSAAEDKVCAVIIDYAEVIAPDADIAAMSSADRTNLVTLERWGKDALIANSGNPVFLVTSNLTDLHAAVRAASSKYEAIEIPLPDSDARFDYIQNWLDKAAYSFDMQLTAQQLANGTAGLSLVSIEDIFLRAENEGALTWELVKERKDSIIASEYEDVIEMIDPRFGFEMIGGLQHVKDFFQRSVIKPMRAANYKRVPMGVLFTGAAGTGKSAVAEAVAYEAGVNACKLNLAKIFGGIVGATERNLEKALRMIVSLSPTIVFIDEIDQSVQRNSGQGDSGVSARVFKRLLEVMSDTGNRGRVLWLAATNRPDMLDAALRRPGRFDAKVPFIIPDDTERAAIFNVMCRKYSVNAAAVSAQHACVKATDGWTGAEIEAATVKAGQLMEDYDMDSDTALAEAVKRLRPSTADIQFMELLAIQETNDMDLLPERYRTLLADRKALEAKIEESRPADLQQRGKRSL